MPRDASALSKLAEAGRALERRQATTRRSKPLRGVFAPMRFRETASQHLSWKRVVQICRARCEVSYLRGKIGDKSGQETGSDSMHKTGVHCLTFKFACQAIDASGSSLPPWDRTGSAAAAANDRPRVAVAASATAVKLLVVACGILAGAMFLLSPPAALSSSTSIDSKFVGAYLSHTGKDGPLMNVSLGADGAATVTEDPGNEIQTSFGRWAESGGQITVTFEAVPGKPSQPPMIFKPVHDGLQAVTWNHALWGKTTPPPMQRAHKVKEVYWLTSVP